MKELIIGNNLSQNFGKTGRIGYVLRIGQNEPLFCVRSGKDGLVGVPEQTLVVPDRDLFRPGAPLDHISGSVNDAVSTHVGSNVTAAKEKAVGDVGRASASSEVVKAVGCVAGVGGENGEEGVEAKVLRGRGVVSFNFDEHVNWEWVKKTSGGEWRLEIRGCSRTTWELGSGSMMA
ncbi:hypothetical protein RHSIM_Rhsim13G0160000 [Rhododendron simsii]|uniref:Uncharacterized protein n=1 Tax=Rhododendron simsii TaxID=118357 RepID=A0A834FY99_RHOSS|nr:hypothetical protein RHSIM_Rhsim13G0160000 [Rhododendron simsii]